MGSMSGPVVRSLDDSLKMPTFDTTVDTALDTTLDATLDEDSEDDDQILAPPKNHRFDVFEDWDLDIRKHCDDEEDSLFSFDEGTFQSFSWSDAGRTEYGDELLSID